MAICKFLTAMRNRRAIKWTDIKELSPLKFMPYVAELFKNIMGKDLKGLSDFTGWIGLGGYYHWKLAQLGQLQACPCLQGHLVPNGPIARPSERPHPQRSTQTGTPATGASGRHQHGSQPTSDQGGKTSTLNQGGKMSTSNQDGKLASTGRGRKQATSGGPVDLPSEREGVGDGGWRDWYERSLWGAEGGMSEPQGPPYPIGTAQARQEAIGQIYNRVDSKDPPPCNIASEAIQAYYPRVEPLDMALSEEPAASGSLVWARHSLGCLLAYFLVPGTTWGLQFEDVIDQVLRENRRHNERKCNESTSSLQKCHNRRTKLRDEFDAVSKTMEVITDAQSRREMEQRLNALQTSLNVVETSITKLENLIEDCQMVEEEVHCIEEDEACQEEEVCQEEEEEIADIKMIKEEEHGDPESSGPHREANTEGIPPLVSAGDTVSPDEDALLMQQAPQPEDPVAGSHSPRSETGTISGGMAELCLTSPSHPGPEEDETPP